ncbi:MAG TPA: hypothetical protein VMX95_03030 [Thermodesulfobacteriota bacterium]|nr:hypothetical protein [Thermodesulfobacteriota bacterium]
MKTIPYFEKILETLTPLNPRPMKTYRGEDISRFEKIETDMMTHDLRCFKADKVDKIITLKADIMGGKLIVWGTTIVPADEYPLPLFTSEIVQAANHLSLRADLIPLADCGRDMEYLEKYMAPMEEIWKKHKDIAGMGTERYLWQRVMLSPFYAYGKCKYDIENIEEKALEITMEYLKLYTKFWAEAQKADSAYMELLNGRKRAMLKTMMENDPGEGPLKKALGEETARKILALLF